MDEQADEPDSTEWGLVVPFLTDNFEFARGVGFGMFYEQLKAASATGVFETTAIIQNQEQILLTVNRLGWEVEELDSEWYEGWFKIRVRKKVAPTG